MLQFCISISQYINISLMDMQVKLVRCKIENVPVDISFNQLGGLSTVCFLEKVLPWPFILIIISIKFILYE